MRRFNFTRAIYVVNGRGSIGVILWTSGPQHLAGFTALRQLHEELVTARRAIRVLLHDLLEERGDLVLAGVPRVTDVLSVIVTSLQRVVLDADQVVADVVEAGFTGCHDEPPSVWIGI